MADESAELAKRITEQDVTAEQAEALLRQLGIVPSYELVVFGVDAEGEFFSDTRPFETVDEAEAALAETESETGVIAVQAAGSTFFRLPVVNAVREELGLEPISPQVVDTEAEEAE